MAHHHHHQQPEAHDSPKFLLDTLYCSEEHWEEEQEQDELEDEFDSRFISYLPSVLATATMMHVFNSVEPYLGVEYQSQLLGILGINKNKVDECCKLMLEVCLGYEQGKQCTKRNFGSIPGSPNAVMDVSFSCDSSSNDSWVVSASSVQKLQL